LGTEVIQGEGEVWIVKKENAIQILLVALAEAGIRAMNIAKILTTQLMELKCPMERA